MASTLQFISLLLMFLIFSDQSFAFKFPSPQAICNFTAFPDFCNSTLSHEKPGTIDDYDRVSIRQSLKESTKFLSLVQHHLRHPSTLNLTTIRVLEDCQFLATLNIDFLSHTSETIKSRNTSSLDFLQGDDLHTLLSAVLTNQQTCLDGLESTESAWSIKNDLLAPLVNGSKFYSVSLGLFKHSLVPKKGRRRKERHDRDIYETVLGRRKLLQTAEDNVVVSQMVVVNPNGTADFTNINDAVAAAPNNTIISNSSSNSYFVIYVVAGIYEEYVSIPKNKQNLMMIGDGINQTVITGNRSVADGWTTFNSATFIVVGQGFVAANITFRNTAGAIKHQAVSVRNGADLSTFYSCSFEGYQDTLYTHSLRQFYRDCDIYGTVDFIFGNAAVVLQNCNIYPRLPMTNQFNAITAQGRADPNQNTGISIQNCTIKAADDLALAVSSGNATTITYLGRPWRNYSRTVYMQSFMDSVVDPSGWKQWSDDLSTLSTLYYAEFENSGPGSNTTDRVTWPGYHPGINATDAANFTVSNFTQGDEWLPATGVPYMGGLVS